MVIYGLIVIPVMLGLALLFALLLDAPRVRFQRLQPGLAIFLPYAVPMVIASLLWGFMYLPDGQPVAVPRRTPGRAAMPELLRPTPIYFSVANIAVWGGTGLQHDRPLHGLRAIPSELYEAARIDGGTEVQIALRDQDPDDAARRWS